MDLTARRRTKMIDIFSTSFNNIISLFRTFSISDFLDIAVVSFLIYSFIKLVRETRAEQLVKGILILVVAWILSTQLHLKMLGTLLDNFFEFSVLAMLVVFQPEIRRALEQIGRTKLKNYWSGLNIQTKYDKVVTDRIESCIISVSDAAAAFSKTKTGALIVFERKTKLGEIVNTGTIVNASVSAGLIGNIFYNKAPLHDGAMIIREGKILAAGCILPLTKNDDLSADLGTRHRAALGMSEVSDAVVLVVSEETGTISICTNSVMKRNYSRETLKSALEKELLPEASENKYEPISLFSSFRRTKKNEDK